MNTDDKLRDTLQEWLLSERQYRAGADLIRSRFVVIDRNDLPPVLRDALNGTYLIDGVRYTGRDREDIYLGRARRDLAMAEHLRKNPPVDEKAVEELAAAIEADPAWGEDGDPATIARRLIADGWTKP